MGQITGITPTVSGGVLKIRTAVLKIFGLTPEGALIRNADNGRIMKAPPISTQIATAVSNLRTGALRIFGIGADGKALPIQGADGKFKAAGDFTKFLAASFRGLVSTFQTFVVGPISSIFKIVRTVATGVSSTVGNLVRPIAKIAATFGKLFGKILAFKDFIAKSCAFSGSKLNIKGLIKENIKTIYSTFFPLNQLSL